MGGVGGEGGEGPHATAGLFFLAGTDLVAQHLENGDGPGVGGGGVQHCYHCSFEFLVHDFFKCISFGLIVEPKFPNDPGKVGVVGCEVPFVLTELVEFLAGGAGGFWVPKGTLEKCEEGSDVGDVKFFRFFLFVSHYRVQCFPLQAADRVVHLRYLGLKAVRIGEEFGSYIEGEAWDERSRSVEHRGIRDFLRPNLVLSWWRRWGWRWRWQWGPYLVPDGGGEGCL